MHATSPSRAIASVCITLAAAASTPVRAEPAQAEVRFSVAAGQTTLSDVDAEQLAAHVRDAVADCGLNSARDPQAPWGADPENAWRNVETARHLRVRFVTPIEIRPWFGPVLRAHEVLIGAGAPGMLGPVLTRETGGPAVIHIKCSGQKLLALTCSDLVAPRLAPEQRSNCHLVAPRR